MRYGAVPVVRSTGGLRDSVTDADRAPEGTGFVFEALKMDELALTLRRAMGAYEDKSRWHSIQRRGMSQDHSWSKTAGAYADLYTRLMHDEF